MSAPSIGTVSIIGAGNVAVRLGLALKKTGIRVLEVCNRTSAGGLALARKTGAKYVSSPGEMTDQADLVLISVSDDAIQKVIAGFRTRSLVAHTSGSLGLDVLSGVSPRTGVLYPLQTFRKGRRLTLHGVPFCIEASNTGDEALLSALAGTLSGNVAVLDSEQRRILHLSAVFASNFPNFLYSIAERLLSEKGIPFQLLYPLIRQTAGNAKQGSTFSLQTGPAVRQDNEVLEIHRKLLNEHPEYLRIYDLISNTIIEHKDKHGKL